MARTFGQAQARVTRIALRPNTGKKTTAMSTTSSIPFDANEFTGQRILVTGGTKGIGEAIVTRLRRSGATVITTARSAHGDLPEPDLFVQADISTREGVDHVIKQV